jgi:hypothetical protein
LPVAEPSVRLLDQPEAIVPGGELPRDVGAAVHRAVVDHHDLEVAEGLPGDRLEALLEVGLDVVDRYDDADARHARDLMNGAEPGPRG